MALKQYRPATPGQRQLVLIDRTGLHKGDPVKSLTEGKHSSGGRNNTGRIVVRWQGGGHKQRYRIIDFKRIGEIAQSVGARAIVKGLRAISDFEYELEMHQLNRRQAPEIESVYLMASPQYSFLRSSGVKELATFGGNIDDLVPDYVAARLKEELGR